MKREIVIQKLESEVNRRRAAAETKEAAEKINIRNVLSLRYVKRDNYLTNYKDSCGVNLDTMEGHSYRWYSLVKRIKGVVYLNTYGYSNQTSKHVYKMHGAFRFLGIQYKCLEAPRGLQDLDSAFSYAVSELAKFLVKQKYARKKSNWSGSVSYCRRQLAILETLGFRLSERRLKLELKAAETERTERNARLKEVSTVRRQAAAQARKEYLAKAAVHLAEIQKTKYAYRRVWRTRGVQFQLFETAALNVETPDLMNLKSVPGTARQACLNYLKVMDRLQGARNAV